MEVAPHSETKYHQHDRDYVWVALGDSDVESVRVGATAVSVKPKDGETQFTKGGFAHKAVNRSDRPFRNVTVELKQSVPLLKPVLLERVCVEREGDYGCVHESAAGEDNSWRIRFYGDVLIHGLWTRAGKRFGAMIPVDKGIVVLYGGGPLVLESKGKRVTEIPLQKAEWLQVPSLGEFVCGQSDCRYVFIGIGNTVGAISVTQGPSRQKEGALDDKAKGVSKK